jgi:hypothetical protein
VPAAGNQHQILTNTQIDYIAAQRSRKNHVIQSRAYELETFHSDDKLLMARLNLRKFKYQTQRKPVQKERQLDYGLLAKNTEIRAAYEQAVQSKYLEMLNFNQDPELQNQEPHDNFVKVLHEAAKETLPFKRSIAERRRDCYQQEDFKSLSNCRNEQNHTNSRGRVPEQNHNSDRKRKPEQKSVQGQRNALAK